MIDPEWDGWRRALAETPPDLQFDGEVKYAKGFWVDVPRTSGVYLISDLRGFLYVGKSGSLYDRYDQHLTWSHNRRLRRALMCSMGDVWFRWITAELPELDELERLCVSRLIPLCNNVLYRQAA